MQTFRDRDYFQDKHGDIFQVLGSLHPPTGVIALQKYERVNRAEEDEDHLRQRLKTKKNPLDHVKFHEFRLWQQKGTQDQFLRILPNYSSLAAQDNAKTHPYASFSSIFQLNLIQVPYLEIQTHWEPTKRFKTILDIIETGAFEEKSKLDGLERESIEVGLLLHEHFQIPLQDLGITGSILWHAQHESSDIDLMIYGHTHSHNIIHNFDRLDSEQRAIRGYTKLEVFEIAQKMAIKSGLPLDECFEYVYLKPYQFYHYSRKISITFAPSLREILTCPLFHPTTEFHGIGPCLLEVIIIQDEWGYDYPGLFEVEVKKILKQPQSVSIPENHHIRLLIYEHEFVGYYHQGDRIQIKGMLQKGLNIPQYSYPEHFYEGYQVLIGGHETFGNEYVRKIT